MLKKVIVLHQDIQLMHFKNQFNNLKSYYSISVYKSNYIILSVINDIAKIVVYLLVYWSSQPSNHTLDSHNFAPRYPICSRLFLVAT